MRSKGRTKVICLALDLTTRNPISNHQFPKAKICLLEGGYPGAARGIGFHAPLNFLAQPSTCTHFDAVSWQHLFH